MIEAPFKIFLKSIEAEVEDECLCVCECGLFNGFFGEGGGFFLNAKEGYFFIHGMQLNI